ncbi:MAG: putative LPS assembly protein LptD [Bacteroidota bacterium]|nr:putative LPS assembly protein LptD [Bacteroidota bacterium]
MLVFQAGPGLAQDTIKQKIHADTIHAVKKHEPIKAKVEYKATDSLHFNIKNQKVFLYKEADIKYQNMEMKADYIEIDFHNNRVHATGLPDSTGKKVGIPQFSEGSQKFESQIIDYNYNTKKGYIQTVSTQQDEGYLHGTVIKKMEDDITYIHDGWYTTCNKKENPDFEFKFGKAKVIPGKRVITGPAYMIIADVPTPLMIPFGYFPNRSGRRNGIIIPTYGESSNRGFFLQQGGYYWSPNDFFDVKLVGDIYSHGSWAVSPTVRYNYRYHYSGDMKFGYSVNLLGTKGANDFQRNTDFKFQWIHTQDSKARPHSNFSANVNIQSSAYDQNNLSTSTQSYLTNTYSSNITYSTSFANDFYLILNASHSQNTLNKTVDINLPSVTFFVNQFYPFRKKNRSGKIRWYENISTKYNLDAENHYSTTDTTIFRQGWTDQLQNGIRNTIPVSGTFRIFKFLNWTNSINMTDRMYFKSVHKEYITSEKTGKDTLVVRNVPGFRNGFDGNMSTSVNTRLYGMFTFKKGPVIAVRHMITPTVSFSFTPDFSSSWFGYYRYIDNDTNKVNPQKYSIFENSLYGSPASSRSGLVSFSISNNLEMKVRNRKDTVTGTRKIKLIEDFTLRMSYDVTKDSLNWSKLYLTGYTTLFKGLKVNYSSSWDPYARNASGASIAKTEWDVNHRLFRLDNTTWTLGMSYNLSSDKAKKKKTPSAGTPGEQSDVNEFYDYYVDFDIPWSFSLGYNFSYSKDWNSSYIKRVGKVIQTLNLNGQLNITPKWKVSVYTGYDFANGQLSYTRLDIYRDLHCWEMRFGWVPKGGQQQWDFSINVKASILQDLKLSKKKDFRDYAE